MNKSIELVTTTGLLMTTDRYNELIAEIEQLQAELAMQAEALNQLEYREHGYCIRYPSQEDTKQALNATQPTVDKFMAKKKAEWEKSVLEVIERQKVVALTGNNVAHNRGVEWCIDAIKKLGGVR